MRNLNIWNHFKIYIFLYSGLLIITIVLIVKDYTSKWFPLIILVVACIPGIISHWGKFTEKEEREIDVRRYSPIIIPNTRLEGKYYCYGTTDRIWFIRLNANLYEKYTIIPRKLELYEDNGTDLVSKLRPVKPKPPGTIDHTDKFFNNSISGGKFTLNIGNFKFPGRPDKIGMYKIAFTYEIKNIEITKFYPIELLFNG